MGRPSLFSVEIAQEICSRIMDGESLRKICRDEHMPERMTIFRWLHDNTEFCDQYARAREIQADTLAEEILEIADDGRNDTYTTNDDDGEGVERVNHDVIARSRLRVDARKWYASKLSPKKYGDKVQQEISGPDGGAITVVTSPISSIFET